MSYLVFARKYRPADFSSVTGQEPVTRTLANAIKRGKVAHAYLFSGPRGVGKTSIARIFSKALNCEKGPTASPCLKCTNCLEIAQGNSIAVREIDGASHNSVDNVRELIDSFRSLPAPGSRYKVYIIDEVHMLSSAAFNALLKSLEEPPPHTVFILATTESHKIPDTVISRCQRLDLRALNFEDIQTRLKDICNQEKIVADDESIRMIARLSEGSMRDAQSLLDRVHSFCDDKIVASAVGAVLGTVERRVLFRLSEAIFSKDAAQTLSVLDDMFKGGVDISLFLKEFVTHFRDLLVARFSGEAGLGLLGIAGQDAVELQRQVGGISSHDLQDLVQLAREGADIALRSAYPKYALEALVVRLATRENVKDIAEILGTLAGSGIGSSGPSVSTTTSKANVGQTVSKTSQTVTPSPTKTTTKSTPGLGEQYNWSEFVSFVLQTDAKILTEQLKRLSSLKFQPGLIELRGPDFSIKYLERAENKKKLLELLVGFTSVKDWRISLQVGASLGSPEPGSLKHDEHVAQELERHEDQISVRNHPTLKSIQSVFPGSSIELTTVK